MAQNFYIAKIWIPCGSKSDTYLYNNNKYLTYLEYSLRITINIYINPLLFQTGIDERCQINLVPSKFGKKNKSSPDLLIVQIKLEVIAGYAKTHALPAIILPYEVKQWQKTGTKATLLGHVFTPQVWKYCKITCIEIEKFCFHSWLLRSISSI